MTYKIRVCVYDVMSSRRDVCTMGARLFEYVCYFSYSRKYSDRSTGDEINYMCLNGGLC